MIVDVDAVVVVAVVFVDFVAVVAASKPFVV